MAVTAKVFGKFQVSMADKLVDLDSDALKVMLCTSSYTPDQDTHQFKSSVTNEVTGTGYTAGGETLTSVAVAYDAGTNTLSLDAADTVWAASTITARYAVIYDSSPGSDATRPLIGFVDFGADAASANGALTLQWAAAGIFTSTAA